MPFYQDGASIVAVKRIVKSWHKGKPSGAYVTLPGPWAGEEVKIKLMGSREYVKTFVMGSSSMVYANVRRDWVDREVLVTRLQYAEKQVHSKYTKEFFSDRKKVVEESTENLQEDSHKA